MNVLDLQGGCRVAIEACREVNGWITLQAPWKLKGDAHNTKRQLVTRQLLEGIYIAAHLFLPFLPNGVKEIFVKLHTAPVSLAFLQDVVASNQPVLETGTKIEVGSVLYEKIAADQICDTTEES